jgi:hypothetical protein
MLAIGAGGFSVWRSPCPASRFDHQMPDLGGRARGGSSRLSAKDVIPRCCAVMEVRRRGQDIEYYGPGTAVPTAMDRHGSPTWR